MLTRQATRISSIRAVGAGSVRFNSTDQPLYLNPHKWAGLPADRVFELHELRKTALGEKYTPNDAERNAILATFESLKVPKPTLAYGYEIDNFKERVMNNTPSKLRGLPPKLSNVRVFDKGTTPHEQRKIDQINRVSAYEMPLLAKFRQEYKPESSAESPVQLTFNTDFSDQQNAHNRKVSLSVKLDDLNLNDKQAKKFKLLAGNKFNHNKLTLGFSTDRYADSTQNARWLVETLDKLLKESKDLTKNTFDEVPVDTRHSKPLKAAPVFPEEWKRPEDAPVKKHRVVRRLVDAVKEQKDQAYIKKLSPWVLWNFHRKFLLEGRM